MTDKPFIPAEAIHPAEYIRDEMKARGWTALKLSEVSGIPVQYMPLLLGGRIPVNRTLAKYLAKAFCVNPQTLVNLQAAYDLAKRAGR